MVSTQYAIRRLILIYRILHEYSSIQVNEIINNKHSNMEKSYHTTANQNQLITLGTDVLKTDSVGDDLIGEIVVHSTSHIRCHTCNNPVP